jgi:hypothetical protein
MNTGKPRLLFFQSNPSQKVPEFLRIHQREHVRCLEQFFEVIVINKDCDYARVCDTYEPDLALFELGVNNLMCQRPKLQNVLSNSRIPKLGFLNADAWCETRAGIVSNLEEYGIRTVFSISTTAGAHLEGVDAEVFYLPVFVDLNTYRDYKERKAIPIFLTGSMDAQYPWRKGVFPQLAATYPCLTWPHPGYLESSPKYPVIYGEEYARTINASAIAPTCGTVAGEVVRKHFEIPACRSCLVTEPSIGLKAAGFRDLENCIFADGQSVVDKLEWLFSHPERLKEITDAGYTLVRHQHGMSQRRQIFQWFTFHKSVTKDLKILQRNPFGPLELGTAGHEVVIHIESRQRLHLSLVRSGNSALATGDYDAAATYYDKCLELMQRFPEARLGQAICALYRGDPTRARDILFDLVQYSVADYKATNPDPLEWTYYLISLLCGGRVHDATRAAREFQDLHYPELERVRSVISMLARKELYEGTIHSSYSTRGTFHAVPKQSLSDWTAQLCTMLRSCGQDHLAELVSQNFDGLARLADTQPIFRRVSRRASSVTNSRFFGHFQKQVLWRKVRRKLKDTLALRACRPFN